MSYEKTNKKMIIFGSIIGIVFFIGALSTFLLLMKKDENYDTVAKKYAIAVYSGDVEKVRDYMAVDFDESTDLLAKYYSDLIGKSQEEFFEEISQQADYAVDNSRELMEMLYEQQKLGIEKEYGKYSVSAKVLESNELMQEEIDSVIEKYSSSSYFDIKDYVDVRKITEAYNVEMEVVIDGNYGDETLNNTYVLVKYKGYWKVLMVEEEELPIKNSVMSLQNESGSLIDKLVPVEETDSVAEEGYTSIAFFGTKTISSEGEYVEHSILDSVMILTMNHASKEVKIISVYEHLMAKRSDGAFKRMESIYASDGAVGVINVLNSHFDLNITEFITADLNVLAEIVDTLGGIEIDVTEAEAKEMNNYIDTMKNIVGKESAYVEGGMQKLDGVQVASYVIIRKTGGGIYAKAERQRIIIEKILEKEKNIDNATLMKMLDSVFPQVTTNLTSTEMLAYAIKTVKQIDACEGQSFPIKKESGTIPGSASVIVAVNQVEEVEELHEFLYPDKEYEMSQNAKNIAEEIKETWENRKN